MGYLFIMILLSYLVGAIPTSIISGKLLKNIDIREHGSGNAGATNVFRVLGWKAGTVVLLVDILKGVVSTLWIAQMAFPGSGLTLINLELMAGLAAVFGHIWTVFAHFKGGKGIATAAGMLLGIAPFGVLGCLLVFLFVLLSTRYVSLGSVIAALVLPLILVVQKMVLGMVVPYQTILIGSFIPILVCYTHRANIQRLLKGKENKVRLRGTGTVQSK